MRKKNPARPCQNCGKELKWIQKKFCSVKCNLEFIHKRKPKCLNCGRSCSNKYCSRKCFSEHKWTKLICPTCLKEFIIRDKWRVREGGAKYCSEACSKRIHGINSNYFNDLTTDKLITLGQIIASGHIVDYRTFRIVSDRVTILDISNKLESSYPLQVADNGLFRIEIISPTLILRLIELGVVSKYLYQDVPHWDLMWEGLKRTHCWVVAEDGVNVFRTDRSKVALWVCDKFGGKMEGITSKDTFKGVMRCDWVVVWR